MGAILDRPALMMNLFLLSEEVQECYLSWKLYLILP